MPDPASGNLHKHTNPNAAHQWLLRHFHHRVTDLVRQGLSRAALGAEGQPVRVLDAGCGEGFVLRHLAGALSGIALYGVDARFDALAWARGRGPGGTVWVTGDAGRLPFPDRSFPVVLCLEVLEHLERPWDALEELRRVCSGTLIVSVPNQPFFSLANLTRGKNPSTLGEDPEHRSHWRAATFIRALRSRAPVDRVTYSFPWVIATVRDDGASRG
ncbi:MAG: class I SAM-dependent methyltransferase [Dehalococcoidia bacterium]|nr:class I SAM-dependent methyltransferase [Dehalococcoidia bacterium]